VELTRAPARVGHFGAVGHPSELGRQGVDVVRRESEDGSIAGDAFVVVPLQGEARAIARHHREPRCPLVVAEDLRETELGVERQGPAHVPHHQHGFDAIELAHAADDSGASR